ncbi:MAG TPA: TonB-dependent receptor [Caulobacterales bacterium]|nr:TonB-dependent receptor [Caulobacterales bacterium]
MSVQTKERRGLRARLMDGVRFVGATGFSLAAAASMAAAQEAAPPAADEAAGEDVIVVTGTHIQRPDLQFTNPIISSTAEEIQDSGTNNLLQYLQQIPALSNSLNGTEAFPNAGFSGVDLLNLRNLGTNRTLVLVDGKRHVPGLGGTSSVDISSIPTDLVARVDVLTGGASAVYGADGVSGVVNFVMQDHFEGFRLRAEAGAPVHGGQNTEFVSMTAGRDFAGGRGNIAAAIEYSNETPLRCRDRIFCINEVRFVVNPDTEAGTYPNGPHGPYSRIPMSQLVWFSSGIGGAVDTDGDIFIANFDGRTDAPWDFGTDFDPPNGLYDIGFTYGQGGSGTPTAGYTDYLLPAVERVNFNLFGHYDFTDTTQVYAQLKAVSSTATNYIQPVFDYGYAISVADNPYIPANIRSDAMLNGQDNVYVTRDQFDLGVGGEALDTDTYRAVAGMKGDVTNNIHYDVSYVWGDLESDFTNVNARFEDRFAAAIDVVDPDGAGPMAPTCRINVDEAGYLASFNLVDREDQTGLPNYPTPLSFSPGQCVPLNTFGVGVASQAARDWVMGDLHVKSRQRQQVLNATLNGDFGDFLKLPGGEIGWAVGGEWRRESLVVTPDPFLQAGVTQAGPQPITRGAFEVKEAFAELNLPILRDVFLVKDLSLDWAHRYAEYSTLGSANTWKFGLAWTPIEDITFRATRAEAVRAPNIGELFAPVATDFQFITDPCRPDQWAFGPDPALRQANCTALLTAAGVANPNTWVDPFAAFTKIGRTGGNPNLDVETAETSTFGVIYRPTNFHGFTVSLDYYDITIDNAIQLVGAQDLADQCVDAPSINNVFCDSITRQVGGAGAGGIVDFLRGPQNVAQFATRGIDFTLDYRFEPEDWGWGDLGSFDARLVGNNLLELTFVPLPGAPTDNDLGESAQSDGTITSAPEWQVNFDLTWNKGPWTVHYGFNFTNDLLRYENEQYAADPARVAPEYKYLDGLRSSSVQVRYDVDEHIQFYGGLNNLGYEPKAGTGVYLSDPNGEFLYVGLVAQY